MIFALKLTLLILVIILGIFPSFFKVINENNINENFFSRLSTGGWIFFTVFIFVAIITIIVEVNNEKESNANKEELAQIKDAIKNSGLKYDATSMSIINNSNTHDVSGIKISGNVGGTYNNLNSYMVTPAPITPEDVHSDAFAPLSNHRLKTVMDYVKDYSDLNKTKRVIIFYINETIQKKSLEQLIQSLKSSGYEVVGKGLFTPDPKQPGVTVAVDMYDVRTICIYLAGR